MSSKKLIFRIINRLTIGGPLHHIINLNNLENYQTIVLHGQLEEGEIFPSELLSNANLKLIELKFLRRPINPFYDFLALVELTYWILRYKPEIVHTHTSKPGFIGRIASKICGVKKVYHTFHGNIFDGYFSNLKNSLIIFIERLLAQKFSSKIIAISPKQKKELIETYRLCDEDKCEIINLGLDLHSLNHSQRSNVLRGELKISDQTFLIGIIGRIVPIKNHQLIINAFCKFIRKFDFEAKLVIIGDGPEKTKLMEQIIELEKENHVELRNRIIFTSWRSDVITIIKDFDLICLTSLNEGTPVSIIEAISANIPVLSTNVGGVEDIINQKYGWIINSFDPHQFSLKISDIIQNKPKLKEIETSERQDFISKYSSETLLKNIQNLYSEEIKKVN